MLRVVAMVSPCVVMLFPPLTNTVFFRWGTVTLPFPPYRFDCRPSRPPKLCSRLHKYTMFRASLSSSRLHKCTCFGKSVNWTCSEPVRSMHCLHDQKSLHETCLSGFAREKSILHLSSTLEI